MAADLSKHLGIKEVAARVGVSVRTLQLWAKYKRTGPPVLFVSRRYLYDPRELEDWINRQALVLPPEVRE